MPSLDIEQSDPLIAWLRARRHLGVGEHAEVRVLQGGVSNKTVLVTRASGEQWVLKQALSQLRVAAPWFCSPERIHREALGMRWLASLTPTGAVPEFIFEAPEEHILAMRAVPQPHANWKQLLLRGELVAEHVLEFGRLLGWIHHRSAESSASLAEVFADTSFFESLRLDPFYAYTAAALPSAANFLRGLTEETRASRQALVHGDYSPKNILVHQGRLVLLDHEVIHWGDPAFDVGFAAAHLLCKAHFVPGRREAFALATLRFWDAYAEVAGASQEPLAAVLQARAARHGLGCLLARVAGKSPVDYLDAVQRERQIAVCLSLMESPPADFGGLCERFTDGLRQQETG